MRKACPCAPPSQAGLGLWAVISNSAVSPGAHASPGTGSQGCPGPRAASAGLALAGLALLLFAGLVAPLAWRLQPWKPRVFLNKRS